MAQPNLLLGLLLAALLTTAAFELAPPAATPRSAASLPAAPVILPQADAPAGAPVAAAINQILARPLFTEGRRPATAAAVQATAARADKPPRLSGILVTATDRRAIFDGGAKPVVGMVGTQMGAYRILAITPDAVTLLGPDGTLAVSLAYGTKAADAPAPPPSILDQLNSGVRPRPGMSQSPTLEDMMATLPKTMPPTVNGIPRN